MSWIESRVLQLEAKLENLYRKLQDVLLQLNGVRQQLRGAYQQLPGGGTGSGGAVYFGCTLGSALAHGSSVTGQTVWKITGGSRSTVSTGAEIYNDGPTSSNDIASGKQVICLANEDGTYTVSQVYC